MKHHREFYLNKPGRFEDSITPFMEYNPAYEYSKSELMEIYVADEGREYEYEFPHDHVDLEKSENGSVRVRYSGRTIGFVKDEDAEEVGELMSDPRYCYSFCTVEFGKYVELYEDEDTLEKKLRRGSAKMDAFITMIFEDGEPDPTEIAKSSVENKPVQKTTTPKSKGMFLLTRVLCVIIVLLSLVLMLGVPVAGVIGIALGVAGWIWSKKYRPDAANDKKPPADD